VHQALYCGICWLKLYEVPWLKGLHRDWPCSRNPAVRRNA
jgi:hypothetical protein